jgi:hypothetical protein
MRRQALEKEAQRLGPPADPASDRARDLIERFRRFWELETSPAERRCSRCSPSLGTRRPDCRRPAPLPFLPYFKAA